MVVTNGGTALEHLVLGLWGVFFGLRFYSLSTLFVQTGSVLLLVPSLVCAASITITSCPSRWPLVAAYLVLYSIEQVCRRIFHL